MDKSVFEDQDRKELGCLNINSSRQDMMKRSHSQSQEELAGATVKTNDDSTSSKCNNDNHDVLNTTQLHLDEENKVTKDVLKFSSKRRKSNDDWKVVEDDNDQPSDEATFANSPKDVLKFFIVDEHANKLKVSEEARELPDPNAQMSPDDFLLKLVHAQSNVSLRFVEAKSLKTEHKFFAEVTEDQKTAYTMKVVTAVRTNNLEDLRMLTENEGQRLDCFNRFGESLLHMACRRGFTKIVEYILEKHPESEFVRICDDCGRTVLHDACWYPSPQLPTCKWILERDPTLLLVQDNRGFTPFKYARSEHWPIWRKFLYDNRECFKVFTRESSVIQQSDFQ